MPNSCATPDGQDSREMKWSSAVRVASLHKGYHASLQVNRQGNYTRQFPSSQVELSQPVSYFSGKGRK